MEDKIWYLSQINVLKGLSKNQLMELGGQCGMVNYSKGDKVYLTGDSNDIYFLKKGAVKLVTTSNDGQELIIDIIHVGEIFGKFGEENTDNPQESAVAMDDIIVCFLSISKWQAFMENNLSIKLSILKWMGLRIKRIERRMDLLYFKDARSRIVEFLIDLAQKTGIKNPDNSIKVGVKITHEEIAQLTGNSRQSVTTLMNTLRTEGLINYDRNRITVYDNLISGYQS